MTPRGEAKVALRNVLMQHGLERLSSTQDTWGTNCYTETWQGGVELEWLPDTFEMRVPVTSPLVAGHADSVSWDDGSMRVRTWNEGATSVIAGSLPPIGS